MPITRWFDQIRALRLPEHRVAWSLAIAADALQIGLFPLFAAGGLSPLNAALDALMAALLTRTLGWHWAFLPSFASEMLPGFDLFPTWTAAVWFVTRGEQNSKGPEILPAQPIRTR
ncbi:MAG TPA: hypothetical protein VN577_08795 [Terriglobales bacterium]|nr:hypothetical protein [Terriglobales bacterium]